MFYKLCGDEALGNVVLVTNMWGEVSSEVGQDRENQLSNKFFKPALDKHARTARHHNTVESAHDIIRMIIEKHPVVLRIQQELVDEQKDLGDTAAGEVLNQELKSQMRRHEDELKVIQEEMMRASNEKDEEVRQELEEEAKKLRERMDEVKKDSDGMSSDYATEKERMGAKVKEMEQVMKGLRDFAGDLVTIPI